MHACQLGAAFPTPDADHLLTFTRGMTASHLQGAERFIAELKAAADSARATAQRHQDVVASVTADNLLFLLRAKSAAARADAATAEADQLRAAALEGRDPWLTQVRGLHMGRFICNESSGVDKQSAGDRKVSLQHALSM